MRNFLLLIVLMLVVTGIEAKPVGLEEARVLAGKFVVANMSDVRSSEVNHVYTLSNKSSVPCLYVMNYEKGYVILSADDVAKPILAYSDEGQFDPNNIPEGMAYYLDFYKRQIGKAVELGILQDDETAMEWRGLRQNGLPLNRDGRSVSPMLATSWDQDSYYNYYCPSTSYGPSGKAYAGCVACAMSQVMKYWNFPEKGKGSHSYVINISGSELNGTELSVDFSSATYDWNNMPGSLGWSSSSTQRNAIALLMYHCGVSVDMGYSGNGSGTQSQKVPNALKTYFSYSNLAQSVYRDNYSKTEFEDIVMNNLDNGFPTYYSGSDEEAGHAFVCDGYDNNRKFHFNWGWSGEGNGYFAVDALNPEVYFQFYNFNLNQTAIINIMPDYIAASLPLAPDPFVAQADSPSVFTGTVTWTNPTKSWSNETLASLSKVVLMRDGNVIKTFTSVQPGQEMSYNDEVPAFGVYEYSVYAVSSVGKGYVAKTKALYGPSCEWRFMCSSNNIQGWPGGGLTIYNSDNDVVREFTLTSSGLKSEYIAMPEGNVTIKWSEPTSTVSSVSIIIQNEAGQSIVSHTNVSSSDVPKTVYSGNNQCNACAQPIDLEAEVKEQGSQWGVSLTWNRGGNNNPSKYYIYRSEDGVDYAKLTEVSGTTKTYFDPVVGDYFYKVSAKYSACESDYAISTDGYDYVHIIVTSVNEISQTVLVYPNPASDKLYIKANGLTSVAVFNMVGQVAYVSESNENEQAVDLSEMSPGIYMVKVSTIDGDTVKRVSIVR